MKPFFQRNWFLCLLVLDLTMGFSQHRALASISAAVPETWLVAVVLFLMSLPLDWSSMWQALRRPKAVLLAVAINSLLLPLVAWAISIFMHAELGRGLVIVASIPTTLASCAVLTRRGGGNDAVAVLVTVVTNLLCFLVTPFWLSVALDLSTAAPSTSPAQSPLPEALAMAQKLFLLVVAPIVAAQLLRLVGPVGRRATAAKIPLGVLAQMGLLLMVLIGAVTAGGKLAASQTNIHAGQWLAMFASVSAVHLAMLWCGHALGRAIGLPREDRIAVGFAGSQKTLMVGLHIALSPPYNSGLAMLPMVAYHVCQLVFDTLIANRLRDRAAAETIQSPPADI